MNLRGRTTSSFPFSIAKVIAPGNLEAVSFISGARSFPSGGLSQGKGPKTATGLSLANSILLETFFYVVFFLAFGFSNPR